MFILIFARARQTKKNDPFTKLNSREVPPKSNQIYISPHDMTDDWKHFVDSKLCDKSADFSYSFFSSNVPENIIIYPNQKKGPEIVHTNRTERNPNQNSFTKSSFAL